MKVALIILFSVIFGPLSQAGICHIEYKSVNPDRSGDGFSASPSENMKLDQCVRAAVELMKLNSFDSIEIQFSDSNQLEIKMTLKRKDETIQTSYPMSSAQENVKHFQDAKAASAFLMFHPDMISKVHSQLPSVGEARCYPYIKYVETNSKALPKGGTATIYIFDSECHGVDNPIAKARIELIENRTPEEPRDDYVTDEVKVTSTLKN